ncbi:FixJ family two-component response regulator [Paraburkholderia sp. MM5496-R1]|uniref:response regulator transcription factor n=1 Tax=unclassified Paraburkholderia TaxID=2615204 RepID=UPI003D1C5A1A
MNKQSLASDLMSSRSPSQRQPRASVSGIVWIVDDDESSRLALESLVQSLGYSTETYSLPADYLAARASHRRTENGVLLSDVRMPGMSGLELLDRLVALGAAPPTIFVSAFPSDALRAQVQSSTAITLLDKPVDAALLKRALGNVGI